MTRRAAEDVGRVEDILYRCIEREEPATYADVEFLLNRTERLERGLQDIWQAGQTFGYIRERVEIVLGYKP